MSNPKIALIIGSTRASRFADIPAQWMLAQAKARTDMDVELVDLRDFDLPLFDEVASNMWAPSADPRAVAWQKKLAEYDGYIFVVAEYNRSITGALKNALDQAYVEWAKKPFTAIAYGSVGGTRALEHLRLIGVELADGSDPQRRASGHGRFLQGPSGHGRFGQYGRCGSEPAARRASLARRSGLVGEGHQSRARLIYSTAPCRGKGWPFGRPFSFCLAGIALLTQGFGRKWLCSTRCRRAVQTGVCTQRTVLGR